MMNIVYYMLCPMNYDKHTLMKVLRKILILLR